MARSITFQSIAFFLVVFSRLVKATAVDYPVGLSLGQYYWSSAYYNAQNELVKVITINSSPEWQDYFQETWTDRSKHPEDYDPKTISMFSGTLKDIQAATETALSYPVEIRSITAPAHFSEGESCFNLRESASRLGYYVFSEEEKYDQVIFLFDAARLAYSLDSCKAFGVEEGCNIFQEDNFALVVEHSPQYSTLTLLSITDYLCAPEGKKKFPWKGEGANGRLFANPSSVVFIDLAHAIKTFMDEKIQHLVDYNVKDPEQKVRGIILAGEASKDEMEDLKQVVKVALPEYKDRFLFDVDPMTIGAVGAAHRARTWATDDAIMNPREPAIHNDL